jgi:hypothetical protein
MLMICLMRIYIDIKFYSILFDLATIRLLLKNYHMGLLWTQEYGATVDIYKIALCLWGQILWILFV